MSQVGIEYKLKNAALAKLNEFQEKLKELAAITSPL